jgi:hypothetical protein
LADFYGNGGYTASEIEDDSFDRYEGFQYQKTPSGSLYDSVHQEILQDAIDEQESAGVRHIDAAVDEELYPEDVIEALEYMTDKEVAIIIYGILDSDRDRDRLVKDCLKIFEKEKAEEKAEEKKAASSGKKSGVPGLTLIKQEDHNTKK